MSALKIKNLKTIHCLLIIAVFGLVAYANVYQNKFLWDDEFLIDENNYIMSFSNIGKIFSTSSTAGFGTSDSFYRPMQMLAYTIAYNIGGHDEVDDQGKIVLKKRVWVFHALNVLLHIGNALLLFLLIKGLFGDALLALLSSCLWVVHPVHTEAITYMSGTADPLSALFLLTACLLYSKFKKSGYKKWSLYLGAILCFPLALLSKEAIIILPGLIMIVDFLGSEKRIRPWTYRWTLPFWLLAFAYLYLRETVLDFESTYQFYDQANIYTENIHYRAFTFLATLPEYLKMLFYPVNLHMERSFPVFVNLTSAPVLGGLAIFLISLAGALWQFRSKKPIVTFAFLWFFITFVPMSGILLPVNSFLLEHWLYISSMGFFVLLASIIKNLLSLNLPLKPIRIAPALIMLLLLATFTLHRNRDWKDPLTFYSNVLQYNEGTARIHNNLAMAYAEQESYDLAATHYIKAIKMSDDQYPQPHFNLARIYIRSQNYSQARKHLLRSLEIQPSFKFSQDLLQRLDQFLQRQPTGE